MSTRANIIIKHGHTKLVLYRHCDGYVSGTGADLLIALKASQGNASKFIKNLLAATYEKQSYESEARPVYEVTSEVHDDIEFFYDITFFHNLEPLITICECTYEHGSLSSKQLSQGEPAQITHFVNDAIRASNKTLVSLKAKSTGLYDSARLQDEIV
jgi:hypothetical protein